jgi:sigma-B regulation protein RsbU (phosphoserine phosphatase)
LAAGIKPVFSKRINWFKAVLATGFILGVFLLVETIRDYRYVAGHLVFDHLVGEAALHVSFAERLAWEKNPQGREQLRDLLDHVRQESSDQVAWIRVANQQGEVLAQSGDASENSIEARTLDLLLENHTQSVSETRSDSRGDVLVVALPFRFRFEEEWANPRMEPAAIRRPQFKVAEVALFIEGAAGPLGPLRRNLGVSIAAAIALVSSIMVLGLRFGSYLRGRELEQQVALARQVQKELLPSTCPACGELEIAPECLPAGDVGGDYYDIFPVNPANHRQAALLLGDVSGKGVAAGLVMGIVHGAVRTASGSWNGVNHPELASQLNELLRDQTSGERFVSLFWAYYDLDKRELNYVNAGHCPPFLVRRNGNGALETQRLEDGGPVLGLLSGVPYGQGKIGLRPGDLLVMYSDGVVEASNSFDIEFGEERLLKTIQANFSRTAKEIQQEILKEVREFRKGHPLEDDLTLLVIGIAPEERVS